MISDAVHSGGNSGFYFLPPLVPEPLIFGAAAILLLPVLQIDELTKTAPPNVVRTIAVFTTSSGVVRDASSHQYHVNWATRDYDLDTSYWYRIRVLLDSREIGFADVELVDSGSQLRNVETSEFVPLLDGRTLPIKFWLGQCAPVVCAATDACHVAGVCDPLTVTCSNPKANDGTPCSDGDLCTRTDLCQSGACVGTDPLICTAVDQCHVEGTCDPASGECSSPAAEDGTPCDDGNLCTQVDACSVGVCVGGTAVVCSALDTCHVPGTCDPATGVCSNPPVPDGTPHQWSAGPDLPAPRRSHSSFVHDGFLFVAGGLDNANPHDDVFVAPIAADGGLGAWSTTQRLPRASDGHATVIVQDRVYLIAGDHSWSSAVSYAPIGGGQIGAWAPAPALPSARAAHAAVATGGHIYVIGGTDPPGATLDQVLYADVAAEGSLGPWLPTTSLPTGRRYLTAETDGAFVYAIGGITAGRQRLSTVLRAPINADGSLGSWDETSAMSISRTGHASTLSDETVVVFGGVTDGDVIVSSVEGARVGPPGWLGSFSVRASLDEPSWLLRAASSQCTLFVTGGENSAGTQRSVRIGR